jgi:hypothetical protein
MNDTVRIGGRAVLPDGADLVWSVAGGLRGRRWREAVSRGGGVERSLMLEASPVGGPIRLEMTSRGGLLTLHPSSDERELHGNVVTPAGVRHLRFDWSFEHELFVVGSPAAAAVALRRFADIVAVGESRPVPVIWVDDALEPRPGAWQLTRTGPETWSLGDLAGGESTEVRVDVDGIPVLAGGERWALQDD